MGDAQSAHVSGKTTLFERISDDIGSGNEGDMIDMQCTVSTDPDTSPAPLLIKKDIIDQGQELGMRSMQSTQESILTEEGSTSIRREDLSDSTKKRRFTLENPEEDEIELMFKLTD